MRLLIAVTLMSALLPACGSQISDLTNQIKTAQAALSSNDVAAAQLYLDDVTDSAAEDTSTASSTSTTTPDSSSASTDASTEADTKDARLDQMVTMVMSELDADSSGSLTLEEFLVGPKKRADDTNISDADKAKITAKMTADFNANAGDDKLLSPAELKVLLKSVAPRVGRHRGDKFPGQQQEDRVKLSAAELIAKYDTDGDGKLDATELAALQADHKAEVKDFREGGRGPRPGDDNEGGNEGQGQGGNNGRPRN